MPDVAHDKKDQLEKIMALIVEGETLYAVYDLKGSGTGFVGFTDRRLIFMDKSGVWRKSKSIVSLPYSKVTAVASEDAGGMIFNSSSLAVIAGSREFEFEFHSREKAHYAYQVIMGNLLQNERAGVMR